jgi:hypothetical protein
MSSLTNAGRFTVNAGEIKCNPGVSGFLGVSRDGYISGLV